jgi:PAS domain S-box-containing protein
VPQFFRLVPVEVWVLTRTCERDSFVMISANAALPGSYDYGEVARSVLIAMAASYAALDLAGRVTAASGGVRLVWLSGGALAMGIGIWAMHFKGMLAFHLPVPVEYHWPTVLSSVVVAIFASAFALYVSSRRKMGMVEALAGSVIMGAAIAGMHCIGMAAMRLPAVTRYSPLLVACSILLAILFSLIALLMAFDLREETRRSVPRRLGSVTVMGVAVSAMHYTGMAAASFVPAPPPDLTHAVSISAFGNNAISIVTLIVLAAAMVTSSVDRRATVEFEQLNQELERRVLERTGQLTAANAALGETEERFRRLVEALPDAIFVVREERIVFVNPSAVRLLAAQRPEQILGKELSEIIHPDSLASIRRRMRDSSQTGVASPPMEHVLIALDGTSVEIESASIPILWKGSPAIEAIARDIKERKRAEARLREYEKAVEGLEEMIVVVDRNYRYVLANRAFLNRRGMENKEQLLGRLVSEVLNPGVFEEVAKKKLDECFQGKVVTYELRYKYPQLGERYLSISYFPIEGPNDIDRVACVLQDITERKQAEAALRESEARFRLVADNAPVMIWMSGTDKLCTYFNKPWLDFTGRSIDQELGNGWAEGVELEDLQRCVDTYTQAFDRREAFRMEYHLRRHDGEYRLVSDIGVPRSNPDGFFDGYIGSCIDVTEQRRAEEQLRQAQEDLARVTRVVAMGELAAAIAHEVNQPLTAIVTNGNFCLRTLHSGGRNLEELREAIAEIVNDGTRASTVISRIRTLLVNGAPERAELDINEVIQDVTGLIRSELARNRISLRTDLTADLRVRGDRVQLQQVLINLIMNSIDAMRTLTDRPRELLIKSANQSDGVLVQVKDSGPGMEPEVAARIFEPFFTTKAEGIGMGLSISRSIVESHGGRLWAVALPNGALFEFTVPTQD